MKAQVLPLILLAIVHAGCHHVPAPAGSSSFKVIEPRADNRPPKPMDEPKEPASRTRYLEAAVQEKTVVLPVYPARALAAKAGAAQVGVRITVDTEGRVSAVRPSMLALTIAPPGFAADFEQAVEAAVRQWRFHPAKTEEMETVTVNGYSYDRVRRMELLEAEFDLAFTFSESGRVEAAK